MTHEKFTSTYLLPTNLCVQSCQREHKTSGMPSNTTWENLGRLGVCHLKEKHNTFRDIVLHK